MSAAAAAAAAVGGAHARSQLPAVLEYLERQRVIATLRRELETAETFQEWAGYARQFDHLLGTTHAHARAHLHRRIAPFALSDPHLRPARDAVDRGVVGPPPVRLPPAAPPPRP